MGGDLSTLKHLGVGPLHPYKPIFRHGDLFALKNVPKNGQKSQTFMRSPKPTQRVKYPTTVELLDDRRVSISHKFRYSSSTAPDR